MTFTRQSHTIQATYPFAARASSTAFLS
jgi:hypothetical protein